MFDTLASSSKKWQLSGVFTSFKPAREQEGNKIAGVFVKASCITARRIQVAFYKNEVRLQRFVLSEFGMQCLSRSSVGCQCFLKQ